MNTTNGLTRMRNIMTKINMVEIRKADMGTAVEVMEDIAVEIQEEEAPPQGEVVVNHREGVAALPMKAMVRAGDTEIAVATEAPMVEAAVAVAVTETTTVKRKRVMDMKRKIQLKKIRTKTSGITSPTKIVLRRQRHTAVDAGLEEGSIKTVDAVLALNAVEEEEEAVSVLQEEEADREVLWTIQPLSLILHFLEILLPLRCHQEIRVLEFRL